jgi:hypothetical protein
MSRNQDYVRDPEAFLPERWLRSETQVLCLGTRHRDYLGLRSEYRVLEET